MNTSKVRLLQQHNKPQVKSVKPFTVVHTYDGEAFIVMASGIEELSEMLRNMLSGIWGVARLSDTYLLASKLWNGQFVTIYDEETFIVPGVLTGIKANIGYEELVQQ